MEERKYPEVTKCDICGKESTRSNHLSDYYAMICQKCKLEHKDMHLLRIIGNLRTTIEDLKYKGDKNGK